MALDPWRAAKWLIVFAITASASPASAGPPLNWSGDFPLCDNSSELLKPGPLRLGVRLATSNPVLAAQFRAAMDFWSTVLDLEWHEENTRACAIEVVDGTRDLFRAGPESMAARSQFPDRANFHGWIAFNPSLKLRGAQLYRIAVHEIGHSLGLQHNSSPASLMYGIDVEGPESLDTGDLASLAAHHKLRISTAAIPVRLTTSRP